MSERLTKNISEKQYSVQNRAIGRNSILLFVRMGILMLINLIAVRFVRSGLGVESYGILNAVFGVTQLLICLGSVLSAATQRYLSMALGESDGAKLASSFSSALRISLLFAAIVVFLFETVGLWFVVNRMVYPPSESNSVFWIYQIAILILANILFQVPFLAATIAHEKINVFAIVTLLEALLKFAAALLIPYFRSNPLVTYSVLLLCFSLVSTAIYVWYCVRHFAECRFDLRSGNLMGSMLSFSAWTLFGNLAGSAILQGNMLVLNVCKGPISNAAFSVALQIYFAFTQLGNNVVTAIRPRMFQSYAVSDYDYLNQLFVIAEKIILWLVFIMGIPLYIWMPDILTLWLGEVDQETIVFSRWMMFVSGIIILGSPITIILQATGRVREYHLLIEPVILLCLPINYMLLSLGYPSVFACYSILCFCLIGHMLRLERLKRYYPEISLVAMGKTMLLPLGYSKVERQFLTSMFNRNH